VKLKRNIDSLADLVNAQQAYAKDIKKVIGGDFDGLKDTAMLDMNKVNRDAMKNILPPAEVIKQQAIQSVGKEQKKK